MIMVVEMYKWRCAGGDEGGGEFGYNNVQVEMCRWR